MEEFIELIKDGADFNFCDENGITPLMKASLNPNPTLLKLIIKHSNQINYKDKFNNTALYYATKKNHLENVKIPPTIDYSSFSSLSAEAVEKLTKIKPVTIGQASRISGVSPSDVSVLLVFLGR